MQYSSAQPYTDLDINGVDRKDKLLKNKMMNEMLVLKDKYETSMSDADKRQLSQEYDKLYEFNYEINRINKKTSKQGDFLNLTLKEIFDKLAMTLIKIIDEISNLNFKNIKLEQLLEIITKRDRLIYVGIILVIISLLVYFIAVAK